MTAISKDTQYAELMSQIRHLGTLRFAMLGIYVALATGLFAVALGTERPSPDVVRYSRWVGTALAAVLAFFEVLASRQYAALADRARGLEGDDGPIYEGRKVAPFGPVTLGTLLIYVAVAAFWWAI